MDNYMILSLFVDSKGGLTMDALAKHDESQFSHDTDSNQGGFDKMSASDKLSIGAKTFNTWATNYTECTNATFNKVHRYWASNTAYHKEVWHTYMCICALYYRSLKGD